MWSLDVEHRVRSAASGLFDCKTYQPPNSLPSWTRAPVGYELYFRERRRTPNKALSSMQ